MMTVYNSRTFIDKSKNTSSNEFIHTCIEVTENQVSGDITLFDGVDRCVFSVIVMPKSMSQTSINRELNSIVTLTNELTKFTDKLQEEVIKLIDKKNGTDNNNKDTK